MAQICPRCNEPTGDESTRCMECGTRLYPSRPSPNRSAVPKEKGRVAAKLLEPVTDPVPAPGGVVAARSGSMTGAMVPPVTPPSSTTVAPAPVPLPEKAVAALPFPAADEECPAAAEDRFELDPFPPYGARLAEVDENLSGMVDHLGAEMESALVEVDPAFYSYLEELAVSSTAHASSPDEFGASSTAHVSLGFEFIPTFDPPEWAGTGDLAADNPLAMHALSQTTHAADHSARGAELSVTSNEVIATHFETSSDPEPIYTLQALDGNGQWRDWDSIPAEGLNVGRADHAGDIPGLNTLAAQHMRFGFELGMLTVEDLGSINGVYLRVNEPVPLVDGMRFRIGEHTLEFREAEPMADEPAATSIDGDVFCSRELAPLAFIDLIRPNGRSGLRFPITKADANVIGREGPSPHIALTGDYTVSTAHAQFQCEDGLFYLEDLRSRHGTFVQVRGASAVAPGDVILAGRVLFRVVGSHDYSTHEGNRPYSE